MLAAVETETLPHTRALPADRGGSRAAASGLLLKRSHSVPLPSVHETSDELGKAQAGDQAPAAPPGKGPLSLPRVPTGGRGLNPGTWRRPPGSVGGSGGPLRHRPFHCIPCVHVLASMCVVLHPWALRAARTILPPRARLT